MTRISNGMPQWFCIHTKPLHENQAVSSLVRVSPQIQENIGNVEIYFPRIRSKMTVAGHVRYLVRPLFPRYFFARLVWEKAARFVASRPQIIGVVQFGNLPSVVPERVIEELRECSVESDAEIFDPTVRLQAGQRVIIQSGPFRGMEAEFVMHLSDQKRVALLMDHLQCQARVTIDRVQLKPVF